MPIEQTLIERSDNHCELCAATELLSVYPVPPETSNNSDHCIYICNNCLSQVTADSPMQAKHWHCLNDSMWSPVPAVQVMAWRLLKRLSAETWAQDQLEMLYLDEDLLVWAKAEPHSSTTNVQHIDSNGSVLAAGDTVTLIKDLTVKGANFTAKRGTAVRNISLVTDNVEHIEGKVEGQRIVLLTQYVKKST